MNDGRRAETQVRDGRAPDAAQAVSGGRRRLGRSLKEYFETLSLTAQLRLTSLLSALAALALAAAVLGLWEVWLSQQSARERSEELHLAVSAEARVFGSSQDLLSTQVNGRSVLAAWLISSEREILSAYIRADAATLLAGEGDWATAGTGWGSRLAQLAWLAPVRIEQPVSIAPTGTGTLIVLLDHRAAWNTAARHLTAVPVLLVLGCVLALLVGRALQARVAEPLVRLAIATRGGSWRSNEDQAGTPAPANPVSEIVDNFEAMRERLARQEQQVQAARQAAGREVVERTADLETRLKAAEESVRAKGDFLANMSHEIRTPMNGVMGMAELLSRTPLDDRQQRFLKSMRAAADSMVQIINDILDVTKIEAGKMEFLPEPFVLRDLVEDVGQLFAARAQTKGLELICRVEPSVPAVVTGDMLRLRQVLGNLVSNAVKYTDHGVIELRVSNDETRDGGRRLFFEVSDTGPGVPPEQHAAIFEAFKQLSGAAARPGGTGLGLPIAVRLVKLMGGTGIDLNSTVGHGSRFSFTLPCETAEATAPARPPDAIRGMRVLVADDNSSSYLFLEEVLASWGAEVTLLSQGRLLLDRLRTAAQERAPIEAILLDHSLPDISLTDALRMVRLDPQFHNVHVVLLSALDFQPARAGNVVLEPDVCIPKPVRQQQLSEALLAARGPRSESDARSVVTEPARGRSSPAAQTRTGLKVLVVDDNAINRDVAAAMLEERGCRITLAQDGAEAVVHASAKRFDLILMDCQMPGLDGYAATENIRREEQEQARTPSLIVALTANVLPRDRERCLAVGMNDVLTKPFTGAALEAILRRAEANREPELESLTSPALPAIADVDEEDIISVECFAAEPEAAEIPPPSVESALPILDDAQIQAIRSLRKPRLLEQMSEILFSDAPGTLRSIAEALAAGDLTTARTAAHALRSPANNLGGRRLAAVLERCELAAQEGRLEAARQAARELPGAYRDFELALRQETERRTGT